LLILKFE
jgi:intraflagellar transport protein 52